MHIANEKSLYLCLRAYTNSLIYNCDFLIVELTPHWINIQEQRMAHFLSLSDMESFQPLQYLEKGARFIESISSEFQLIDNLTEPGEWMIVEMYRSGMGYLSPINTNIEHIFLTVAPDGWVTFRAKSEPCQDAFWTDRFSMFEVLSHYKEQCNLIN